MYHIIVVTENRGNFAPLVQRLQAESDCTTIWVDSVEEAKYRATGLFRCLMVLDEHLAGISNLDIARQIVMENPMVNLALISPLSEEDFHEASEGLGILTQLPPCPGAEDGSKMLADIMRVLPPETKK